MGDIFIKSENTRITRFTDESKLVLPFQKHEKEGGWNCYDVTLKQFSTVEYLGCLLDSTLSGEEMGLKVITNINGRLIFLYRQGKYLNPRLRRMLCNTLIQPHFDYACSAWYPNLQKGLRDKLQIAQNKCIRFCLFLGNRDPF